MTRTVAILAGLASIWLVAWLFAGVAFHAAGSAQLAQAEHVAAPADTLTAGAEVRVEGALTEGPMVTAPFAQTPCLAAVTSVSLISEYRDLHDQPATDSRLVETLRVGGPEVEIAVGERRLRLPTERWSPTVTRSERMSELPVHLPVSRDAIQSARALVHEGSTHFAVSEATLEPGVRVFVVGRLAADADALLLEADPVLGRVDVFPGTREEYLAKLRGSGGGLRLAAWIVGAGVGPLPLVVLGLVLVLRRRRARSSGAPSSESRADVAARSSPVD